MFVVSPDTSIKTLSAAMYVPTIVLKNRNTENQYITGPWDRIFLDKHKWKTLECLPFESIMRKFDKSFNLKMI
jgi:ADP-heptose:LPS heptosyltransferase